MKQRAIERWENEGGEIPNGHSVFRVGDECPAKEAGALPIEVNEAVIGSPVER